MRVKTPQVAWHGREENGGKNDPILSLDVHYSLTLATAGADNFIRIWKLKPNGLELFDHVDPQEVSKKKKGKSVSGESARARPEDLTVHGSTNTTTSFYTFAFALAGHERPVNVIRFSPNGECLASAGDDARVVLWRRNDTLTSPSWSWASATSEREVQYKVFKGHLDDVYDLQWSPNGRFLISGSIDNTAIIWDVRTGKCLQRLRDHSGYVQGVAWDPLNQFIATQSSDRSCRIYTSGQNPRGEIFGAAQKGKWADVKVKKSLRTRIAHSSTSSSSKNSSPSINQSEKPDAGDEQAANADTAAKDNADSNKSDSDKPESAPSAATAGNDGAETTSNDDGNASPSTPRSTDQQSHVMYMDETVPNFFRRLCFSPDGEYLFTPTGCFRSLEGDSDFQQGAKIPTTQVAFTPKFVPTTYMFCRGQWTNPAMHYPGPADASIAVRCCPRVVATRKATKHNTPRVSQADYRILFAVATQTEVLVYDTQHWYPLVRLKDLHYAPISDIAWSPCGRMLCMSSQDGYISFVRFDQDELGSSPPQDKLPVKLRDSFSLPPIFGEVTMPGASKADSGQTQTAGAPNDGSNPKRIAPKQVDEDEIVELNIKRKTEPAASSTSAADSGEKKRVRLTPVLDDAPVEGSFK